jgi:hypothetical protein
VDEAGSGLCIMADLGISYAEHRVLLPQLDTEKNILILMRLSQLM